MPKNLFLLKQHIIGSLTLLSALFLPKRQEEMYAKAQHSLFDLIFTSYPHFVFSLGKKENNFLFVFPLIPKLWFIISLSAVFVLFFFILVFYVVHLCDKNLLIKIVYELHLSDHNSTFCYRFDIDHWPWESENMLHVTQARQTLTQTLFCSYKSGKHPRREIQYFFFSQPKTAGIKHGKKKSATQTTKKKCTRIMK